MEDRNSAEEAARDRAGDAGYTAGNLDGAGYASGYHRGGGAGGADTFGAGGAATSFRDGPVQQQQYRDRRPPVYGNFDREQQEREQEAKRSLANMKMQLGEEPEKYFLRFDNVLFALRAVNIDAITDEEVLAMLRRNLSADYDGLKPVLMYDRSLTRKRLETSVRNLHAERGLENVVRRTAAPTGDPHALHVGGGQFRRDCCGGFSRQQQHGQQQSCGGRPVQQ